MKIKVEEIGEIYRIYRLKESRPMRWPSGEDLEIRDVNMKFLLNEKELKKLENGEFIFNISYSRIDGMMNLFKTDPKFIAEKDVLAETEAEQKKEDIKEASDDTSKVVKDATIKKKF